MNAYIKVCFRTKYNYHTYDIIRHYYSLVYDVIITTFFTITIYIICHDYLHIIQFTWQEKLESKTIMRKNTFLELTEFWILAKSGCAVSVLSTFDFFWSFWAHAKNVSQEGLVDMLVSGSHYFWIPISNRNKV